MAAHRRTPVIIGSGTEAAKSRYGPGHSRAPRQHPNQKREAWRVKKAVWFLLGPRPLSVSALQTNRNESKIRTSRCAGGPVCRRMMLLITVVAQATSASGPGKPAGLTSPQSTTSWRVSMKRLSSTRSCASSHKKRPASGGLTGRSKECSESYRLKSCPDAATKRLVVLVAAGAFSRRSCPPLPPSRQQYPLASRGRTGDERLWLDYGSPERGCGSVLHRPPCAVNEGTTCELLRLKI